MSDNNGTSLAIRPAAELAQSDWNAEKLATLKRTIGKGLSDAEFELFAEVVKKTGLDPFTRQIYAISRGGGMTIQVGIDGFRLQAQRTGEYTGQIGPQWCGTDGVWRDVWIDSTAPSAARVGVWRKGFTHAVWGIATRAEYNAGNSMWAKMPANMLAKCAEAQALRKAFPAELSGIYTPDEMEQAERPAPAPVQVAEIIEAKQPTELDTLRIEYKALLVEWAGDNWQAANSSIRAALELPAKGPLSLDNLRKCANKVTDYIADKVPYAPESDGAK